MAKFISEFINYRLRGSYVELVPEKMWAGPPTSPYGGRTWKDVLLSEVTRRVWEWGRANHNKFVYFTLVARLVALVPITSAAMECVFSQMKYIHY